MLNESFTISKLQLLAFGGICAASGIVCGSWLKTFFTRKRKSARRIGGICRLKPEMYDQYTQLHDRCWDEVMSRMYSSNMRNFVVYFHKETNLMFSHFEYVGESDEQFNKDMEAVSSDPNIRRWWSYCEPCQDPFHWSGKPPSQGGVGEGPNDNWWDPLICLTSTGAWPVEYSSSFPDPDFVPKNPSGKTSTIDNPPSIHNRSE